MPLWQIYHPKGTFADEAERQAMSKDITKIYTSASLPAFYVVVQFIEQAESKTYVGGESPVKLGAPFIRVVITQIAIRLPDNDAAYQRNCDMIDEALKPYIADKGYHWEYHVDETERRLWKIDGLIPPPWKSEEEKRWSTENRPLEYSGAYPASPASAKLSSKV